MQKATMKATEVDHEEDDKEVEHELREACSEFALVEECLEAADRLADGQRLVVVLLLAGVAYARAARLDPHLEALVVDVSHCALALARRDERTILLALSTYVTDRRLARGLLRER